MPPATTYSPEYRYRELMAANEQTRLRDALNAANQSLLLLRVGNGDNIGG